MTYTVLWVPNATAALARIWLHADSRRRKLITEMLADIERRLHERPFEEGESRNGHDRILIQPPLAIIFDVSNEDRVVRVLDVWQFRLGPNKS